MEKVHSWTVCAPPKYEEGTGFKREETLFVQVQEVNEDV